MQQQVLLSEFSPADHKIAVLTRRLERAQEALSEQTAIANDLVRELNAITAAGRCCLCGELRPTSSPDDEPPKKEAGWISTQSAAGKVLSRAQKARAEQEAARRIDQLSDEELAALIERSFNEREDLRERCRAALREGGRKALVFFRPMLIKALGAPKAEG